MFIMHMPLDFKVGERATVKINGETTLLHWRDEHTLVIGTENDARRIVTTQIDGNLRCFAAGRQNTRVFRFQLALHSPPLINSASHDFGSSRL